MHAVVFAPRHQILAGEARIGAHQNAHLRPAAANLGNDARHRLHRAVRRVDARAPQLGVQQMASAEHVERQIAVAVVIAVEEPPLLLAMHRIVGGVEIEDDLARRALMRLQEQVDHQPLDGHRIVTDLVIARRLQAAQLQPVQRRLAGHRRAILAARFELARQHRHHRIVAQFVVIVEILIAERDPEHPLADQRHHLMLDQLRAPLVVKARGEPIHHPDRPIRRAQQQRPGIRGDRPASNAATTSRPSTGANPNKSRLHSVGIGALRESTRNRCSTTIFTDSPPRCTQ